jgi:pyruvate dehydrogenase E1 component alpha subunit
MKLTKEQMVLVYTNLIRAHHFDEMMYRRMKQGKLIGFYHPSKGAMAPGVAAGSFLNKDDNLSPHHRGHGIPSMLSKGIDIKYYLAEHSGKEEGCCKGRSAWHFSFPEHKVYMLSGFIGYNFAPAVGWGWSAKRRKKGQVVMNCSGDGSYGQGRAHEALLMAQNWKLPIIFWCENNSMNIFSPAEEMQPYENITDLADGYGMSTTIVDGQDVFALAETALEVIDTVRNGGGPYFVECKTARFTEHDMGVPDLEGWEPRADDKKRLDRDPVVLAKDRMLGDSILTNSEIDDIYAQAAQEIEDVEDFADGCEIARPTEDELMAAVFSD